ncbi:hypothetical protein F8388_000454 [Cannabis sativa]|uniref:Uncharacterized protein n=1 Tax=Cannabis sativa TaxID=3483 RepID=A0A7J6HG56_CANSA|nr:hypothetical protein F8388_000454 [Cannabis sativa]KAF4394035.1 hypothetical protein G4B88_026004 [Cannabis sativa]
MKRKRREILPRTAKKKPLPLIMAEERPDVFDYTSSEEPDTPKMGDLKINEEDWIKSKIILYSSYEVEVVVLNPTKLEKKADYMKIGKAVTIRTPDKGYLTTASHVKAVVPRSEYENRIEYRPQRGSSADQFDIKQEFSSFRDEMREVMISLKEEIGEINYKLTSLDVDRVEMGKKLTNVVNALYDIESELKSGESRFEIHHNRRKTPISNKDKGVHEVVEEEEGGNNGNNDDNNTAKENGGEMVLFFDQPIKIGVRDIQSNSVDDSMPDNRRSNNGDAAAEMPKETNNDEMVQQVENVEEQSLDKTEDHQSQQGHKEKGLCETNPSPVNSSVKVPEKQNENPPIAKGSEQH